MNSKYPNLLSPGKIGNVELRNKTVMAAMGMSQAENGFVNKAVLNHYSERAVNAVDILGGAESGKNVVVIGGGIIPNAVYDGYTVGNMI